MAIQIPLGFERLGSFSLEKNTSFSTLSDLQSYCQSYAGVLYNGQLAVVHSDGNTSNNGIYIIKSGTPVLYSSGSGGAIASYDSYGLVKIGSSLFIDSDGRLNSYGNSLATPLTLPTGVTYNSAGYPIVSPYDDHVAGVSGIISDYDKWRIDNISLNIHLTEEISNTAIDTDFEYYKYPSVRGMINYFKSFSFQTIQIVQNIGASYTENELITKYPSIKAVRDYVALSGGLGLERSSNGIFTSTDTSKFYLNTTTHVLYTYETSALDYVPISLVDKKTINSVLGTNNLNTSSSDIIEAIL